MIRNNSSSHSNGLLQNISQEKLKSIQIIITDIGPKKYESLLPKQKLETTNRSDQEIVERVNRNQENSTISSSRTRSLKSESKIKRIVTVENNAGELSSSLSVYIYQIMEI
ncbi:unnamed protein product [Phyllotreta striolata]|uniref:Uncharacterized protein n=1 Tax=Phyllotreta striolata TaxID=444603 RepID=A0A9P0GY04_PHYSR|nr:unnamed protein product [Phyllotreta striolata]